MALPITIFEGVNGKGAAKRLQPKPRVNKMAKFSAKQKAAHARMRKAARVCSVKSTKAARKACMKKNLKVKKSRKSRRKSRRSRR